MIKRIIMVLVAFALSLSIAFNYVGFRVLKNQHNALLVSKSSNTKLASYVLAQQVEIRKLVAETAEMYNESTALLIYSEQLEAYQKTLKSCECETDTKSTKTVKPRKIKVPKMRIRRLNEER